MKDCIFLMHLEMESKDVDFPTWVFGLQLMNKYFGILFWNEFIMEKIYNLKK